MCLIFFTGSESVWRPLLPGCIHLFANKSVNQDFSEGIPFCFAIPFGSRALLDTLLLHGMDLRVSLDNSYIMTSALYGNAEAIQFFVEKGSPLNHRNSNGDTAMLFAAMNGDNALIELLIEYGEDMLAVNNHGFNVIICAAFHNQYETISLFCRHIERKYGHQKKKEMIDFKDKDGETSLHISSRLGFHKTVKILIGEGAEINIINKSLRTAMDLAKRSMIQLKKDPNYLTSANQLFQHQQKLLKFREGLGKLQYIVKILPPDFRNNVLFSKPNFLKMNRSLETFTKIINQFQQCIDRREKEIAKTLQSFLEDEKKLAKNKKQKQQKQQQQKLKKQQQQKTTTQIINQKSTITSGVDSQKNINNINLNLDKIKLEENNVNNSTTQIIENINQINNSSCIENNNNINNNNSNNNKSIIENNIKVEENVKEEINSKDENYYKKEYENLAKLYLEQTSKFKEIVNRLTEIEDYFSEFNNSLYEKNAKAEALGLGIAEILGVGIEFLSNNDDEEDEIEEDEEIENYEIEDYQDINNDTPLNKSLHKQLTGGGIGGGSNTSINKKKILYTLWFIDPEWEDDLSDPNDSNNNNADRDEDDIISRISLQRSINIGRQSTRQSNFSPLHNHNMNQPSARLLVSPDGSILASTQNRSISFRNSIDSFSTIKNTWEYPQIDKESQWQRMCYSPDNKVLGFSTSQCTIYLINIENEQTLHILSPNSLRLNPKDGIVDLVIRHSHCILSSYQKCFELIVLGYDMILRRFHFTTNNNSFHIHPFVDTDSISQCYPKSSPIPDLKDVHHSVGCMAYSPKTDILAIGGNRKSKRSSNGDLSGTISLWKVPIEQDIIGSSSSSKQLKDSNPPNYQSFKPFKTWTTENLIPVWNDNSSNQPSTLSSSTTSSTQSQIKIDPKKIVIDISWWSNDQIIAANKGGEFIIFSMADNENCLLHEPEIVSSFQHPILTMAHNGGFFILETSSVGVDPNKKTSLLENYSEYQHLMKHKLKRSVIQKYKSILRYFNGGDTTDDNDEDPFHFHISREGSTNQQQQQRHQQQQPSQQLSKKKMFLDLFKGQFSSHQQNQHHQQEEQFKIIRRIIRFQMTTPEQLFKSKVLQKEYGNALLIAEYYGLDKDLVHQKRWIKAPVTPESLKQLLSKVQDINWVLWSCHIRIPLTLEATKNLINYAMERINSVIDEGSPVEKLRANKTLILHRNILVNYSNRLKAYQEIYGSDFNAPEYLRFRDCPLVAAAIEYASVEHFKAIESLFTYYSSVLLPFRQDILSMIPETTPPQSYQSLLPDELNTWNQKKSFDEDWCQSKFIYENVLELDWEMRFDSLELKRIITNQYDKDYEDIRGEDKSKSGDIYSIDYKDPNNSHINSILQSKTKLKLLGPEVAQWYRERSKEIDRKSGQIENSLSLINIAIEKHVSGLEVMKRVIEEVYTIVYETNQDITLEKYQLLTPLQQLKLLLGESTDLSIYENILHRSPQLYLLHPNLLIQYFEDGVSKKENIQQAETMINWCRIFIQQYIADITNGNQESQLKLTVEDILTIGLNTICQCSVINLKTIQIMETILKSLPERGSSIDVLSAQHLHDLKDQYRPFVQANKLLNQYELGKPITYFLQFKDSQEEILNILGQLLKYAQKNHYKNSSLKSMFDHLLSIQSLAFYKTEAISIYYNFVKYLLSEGKFQLAHDYLNSCGGPERAETLVLNAAKDFFNSSPSLHHSPSMEDARKCLELINPPTRKIIRELNLIKALDILYSRYNYPKLPVQIRLILEKTFSKSPSASNSSGSATVVSPKSSSLSIPRPNSNQQVENQGKFELIQSLIQFSPNCFNDIDSLLQLSNLIGDWVSDDVASSQQLQQQQQQSKPSDKIILLVLLNKVAMEKKNYQQALRICRDLMKEKNLPINYDDVWMACSNLAFNEDFKDVDARMELLSYSMLYCNGDSISSLLEYYQELKLRISISKLLPSSSSSSNNNESSSVEYRLVQDSKILFTQEEEQSIELVPPFIETIESIGLLFDQEEEIPSEEFKLKLDQLKLSALQLVNNHDAIGVSRNQIYKLILDLCERSLQKGDMKSALSYLFLNVDHSNPSETFDKLLDLSKDSNGKFESSLERCTRLACYFYSLLLLFNHQQQDDDETPKNNLELFSQTIETIIQNAQSILPAVSTTTTNKELISICNQISHYYKLMVDSIQAKELSEIDIFVDFDRFKKDDHYKTSTIYSFARSSSLKSLQTSVSMAKRYNLTHYQVLLQHLEWQFLENPAEATNILESEDLNQLRQEKTSTLEFLKSLYDKLDGRSYQKLLYYFDIYSMVIESSPITNSDIRNKKKLLNLLMSSTNNNRLSNLLFDFKQILEEDYDPLVEMKSSLMEDNILFCCNIINHLQNIRNDDTIQNLTISKMYLATVFNLIRLDLLCTSPPPPTKVSLNSSLTSVPTLGSTNSNNIYSIVSKFKRQLDETDLVTLYDNLLVGSLSKSFSIETRISFVSDILNQLRYIHQDQQQQFSSFDDNDGSSNINYEQSQRLKVHYQMIESLLICLKHLISVKDIVSMEFIKSYDEIFSKRYQFGSDSNSIEYLEENESKKNSMTKSLLCNLIKQAISPPAVILKIYNIFYPPLSSLKTSGGMTIGSPIGKTGSKKQMDIVPIASVESFHKVLFSYYSETVKEILNQYTISSGGDDSMKIIQNIISLVCNDESLDDWDQTLRSMLLKLLRDYVYDIDHPINCRIQLLEALLHSSNLYLEEDDSKEQEMKQLDSQLLKKHKTQEIIMDKWKDQSSIFTGIEMEITTPSQAIPLFNRLLENRETYRFVNTPIFNPLLTNLMLSNLNNNKFYPNQQVLMSLEYTIAMLTINHRHYQAASLCLWWYASISKIGTSVNAIKLEKFSSISNYGSGNTNFNNSQSKAQVTELFTQPFWT
eukprot:gene372-469_t